VVSDVRTRATSAATGLTLLLAALQLFWAAFRAPDDLAVTISAFLCLVTLMAGIGLARYGGFEARLVAGIVCGSQILLMLLAVTVGPPGSPRRPLDLHVVVALALPAVILLLLEIDRRARRRKARETRPSSYAL
jgi:hypothetical protein